MLLTPNKMDETHGHGSSGSWNSAVCASLSVSRSSVGSLRRPGTLLVIYPRWGAAPADRKLVAVTTVLRRMIPCFWLETSLSSSVILAMASGGGANFLNTMSTSKTAAGSWIRVSTMVSYTVPLEHVGKFTVLRKRRHLSKASLKAIAW
jgi:hypothetical protein